MRSPTHHQSAPTASRPSRFGRRAQNDIMGWLFLVPALFVFGFFSWYPIVSGLFFSFQKVNLVDAPIWVGWKNFRFVVNDPLFVTAWKNTLQFTLLGLLLGYLVPLLLAILINEARHGRWYFRAAFYLPVVLPPIVTVFLWQWIMAPGPGLLNQGMKLLGLAPLAWLQNKDTAMLSLVMISTWANAGGTMLIYLAALQGIPPTLYDAAELDGASIWRRLLDITFPQVRFVMLIMLILQIIGTMQVFTEPFVLTKGGPANATITVMLLIYRYAFQFGNYGAASALGFILFLVLVVFSALYMWMTRRFSS